MYTNKGNNPSEKKDTSVNTKSFQFFNKDGIDPSTLVFSFWNDGIVVKIHPTLPKDKQDNEHVFDYNHELTSVITVKHAQTLLMAFPKLQECIEKQLAYSVGVRVGTAGVLVLSTGVNETEVVRPYIGIYKNINAETLEAQEGIRYEFNQVEVIEDYDPNGCPLQTTSYHVELYLFMEALRTTIQAFVHAHTHSHRSVQRYFNTKLNENITSMMSHLGLEKQYKPKNTVTTNDGTFNINKNQSGMSNAYNKLDDAKVYHGTIEDIDDLPF